MRIEFLGTGGALTTPKPLCGCRVCSEAREKGVPYSRMGPSVFVHGPDVLIDTPEEIKDQLDRSRVTNIAACFYSHWHGDHVLGWRVFEALNQDWRGWPPKNRCTDIYLPEQVGKDFRKMLGMWDSLAFFERRRKIIRVNELAGGDDVKIGDVRISPFRLAVDFAYAFLFDSEGGRVLIVPDEHKGWEPPEWMRGVDLAVLPMGLCEFDPLTGERRIREEHPALRIKAAFDETLEIVEKLGAKRVILTHIEEMDGLTHDDLQNLEGRLDNNLNISFAFDTMVADV